MKPRLFFPYAIVIGLMTGVGAGHASAGDFHIHIPNPIPKIVRSVKRAGEKVGNAVVRVAERVDDDDSPDTRRDPNRRPRGEQPETIIVPGEPILGPDGRPLPDQPLAAPGEIRREPRVIVGADGRPLPGQPLAASGGITREPIADPSLIDGRRSVEDPRLKGDAANPGQVPSNSASYPAAQQKSASSVRPVSPTSATAETKHIDPTVLPDPGVPVTPPALAPAIKFGKPVPGHPGLVYPPGVEEVPANMLDVQGMSPGTKVRNPVTGSVFRVP